MKPELRYISDTLLLESLAHELEYELRTNSSMRSRFCKEASILDSIGLTSIAGTIKDFVKDNLNLDDGIGKGIGEILLTGAIFRVHPLLGIINAVAGAAGFGLMDVVSYIYNAIKSTLDSGGQVSVGEIQQLAKQATESEVGPLNAEASGDLLYFVKQGKGWFSGYGSGYSSKEAPSYNFMDNIKVMPGGQGSFWSKLMGGTWYKNVGGKKKVGWFLGGIAAWLVTTVLFGAGLMAGSSALTGALGLGKGKKQEEGTAPESSPVSTNEPSTSTPAAKPTTRPAKPQQAIRQTDAGNKVFPNDLANVWRVPIIGGVKNQLLEWTFAIYPDLEKVRNEISSLPSFNKTLYSLEMNYKKSDPGRLIMPQRYHSLKQVVDEFSADAFKVYFTNVQ